MNNTALGLGLAITLLLAHMYLETKTTELVDSLEVASNQVPQQHQRAPPGRGAAGHRGCAGPRGRADPGGRPRMKSSKLARRQLRNTAATAGATT